MNKTRLISLMVLLCLLALFLAAGGELSWFDGA